MGVLLHWILNLAVPLYAITSMASVGAGNSIREVTRPVRRPSMLLAALLSNFVAVPLLGVLLVRAFDMPQPYAVGLLLVSCAAGAPFLVTLAQMARADVALAGGLLLVLLPATIVFMPLVIPRALPEADVSLVGIARPLLLMMLLPLALGMLLRRRARHLVPRVMPVLQKVSRYSLIVLVTATVGANLPAIASLLFTPVLPATLLLLLGALLVGFAGSVPGLSRRTVFALGTGQRNIAASMVVANGFESDEPLLMIVVVSLVGFAVLFPVARFARGQTERRGRARAVRFGTPQPGSTDGRRRV